MSDDMNLSINGQSQIPPGFRFHPTEEELLHYYLRKKVAFEKIDLDVIREVDLNKLEPWDIQEKCKIGSTPQNDWYFFSHKDKKYPTGTRTNRATAAGFWKATGRDKIIYSGFKRIGLRKTLVFYKGRAPHGQKSDWIMHEYRLDETNTSICDSTVMNPISVDPVSEDGWVVCRVFKKKNYQKSIDSPKALSISNMDNNININNNNNNNHSNNNPTHLQLHHQNIPYATNDGVLDQILLYMGRTCKLENDNTLITNNSTTNMINDSHHHDDHDHHDHERFIHLPRLESPTLIPINSTNITASSFNQHHDDQSCFKPNHRNHYHYQHQHHHHHHNLHGYNPMNDMLLETDHHNQEIITNKPFNNTTRQLNDWVALDRLVASQLNGQDHPSAATASFCSPSPDLEDDDVVHVSSYDSFLRNSSAIKQNSLVYGGEADLWSNFAARSSSSPSSSDPLCHLSV